MPRRQPRRSSLRRPVVSRRRRASAERCGFEPLESRIAMAADVGELLLFHHDPCRDDESVLSVEALARARFANTFAAAEGMQRSLPGRARERAA